ncbi:MAG: hypothetical protein LBV15_02575 [Planctomycetota bacterium]|jgi:hypothetical protein|nr:hypothetical protein [Planctomycetota bacterium]
MRKVLDFANVTIAVLAGAYLTLLVLFRSEGMQTLPQWLSSSGVWIITLLAGLFLAGGNIHELIQEWRIGGLRRNLRLSTEQGMTELSVAALEAMILRDLKAESDIIDPHVFLIPHGEGKPMVCELDLKLVRQEDVIKRLDVVKRKVRNDLDRLIPGGLTVDVLIEVKDFMSDAGRSERLKAERTGEFNGPVYSDSDHS